MAELELIERGAEQLLLDVGVRDVDTRSGNPWHSPRTGRFANAPPGVKLLRGLGTMMRTSGQTKAFIEKRRRFTHPDSMAAAPAEGPGDNVRVLFFRKGELVDDFVVARDVQAAKSEERKRQREAEKTAEPSDREKQLEDARRSEALVNDLVEAIDDLGDVQSAASTTGDVDENVHTWEDAPPQTSMPDDVEIVRRGDDELPTEFPGGFHVEALGPDGRNVGNLFTRFFELEADPPEFPNAIEGFEVGSSNVREEWQGRGVGKELYKEAIRQAHEEGFELWADEGGARTSESARGVWRALIREGWAIDDPETGLRSLSDAPQSISEDESQERVFKHDENVLEDVPASRGELKAEVYTPQRLRRGQAAGIHKRLMEEPEWRANDEALTEATMALGGFDHAGFADVRLIILRDSNDQRIVGVGSYEFEEDGELMYGNHFGAIRGSGLALFRRLIEAARDEGVRELRFESTPESRPLYERLGVPIVRLAERIGGGRSEQLGGEHRLDRPQIGVLSEDLFALAREQQERTGAPPEGGSMDPPFPTRVTQAWIERTLPTLDEQQAREVITRLRAKGWGDRAGSLPDRVYPHLSSEVREALGIGTSAIVPVEQPRGRDEHDEQGMQQRIDELAEEIDSQGSTSDQLREYHDLVERRNAEIRDELGDSDLPLEQKLHQYVERGSARFPTEKMTLFMARDVIALSIGTLRPDDSDLHSWNGVVEYADDDFMNGGTAHADWDGTIRINEAYNGLLQAFFDSDREVLETWQQWDIFRTLVHEANHVTLPSAVRKEGRNDYKNGAGRFIEEAMTELSARHQVQKALGLFGDRVDVVQHEMQRRRVMSLGADYQGVDDELAHKVGHYNWEIDWLLGAFVHPYVTAGGDREEAFRHIKEIQNSTRNFEGRLIRLDDLLYGVGARELDVEFNRRAMGALGRETSFRFESRRGQAKFAEVRERRRAEEQIARLQEQLLDEIPLSITMTALRMLPLDHRARRHWDQGLITADELLEEAVEFQRGKSTRSASYPRMRVKLEHVKKLRERIGRIRGALEASTGGIRVFESRDIPMDADEDDGIAQASAGSAAGDGFRSATDDDRKRLVIPPAWTDVVVNDDPGAKIAAIGVDVNGRRQYRYSAAHVERSSRAKFERVKVLAERSRDLEKRFHREMRTSDEALVLALIARTGLRIGSTTEQRGAVKAYGASTLQARHVRVKGNVITLSFVGKKGVKIRKRVQDAQLARLVERRLASRSGTQPLFDTSANRVRRYLAQLDPDFLVKDLRTLEANRIASREMGKRGQPRTMAELKRAKLEVAKVVSNELGNTPSVAMSSYIDSRVWADWESRVIELGDDVSVPGLAPVPRENVRVMLERQLNRPLQKLKGSRARRLLGDHEDTRALYAPDGVYSRARRELHEKLIEGIFEGKRPVPEGEREVLFMAGGAAAGKSVALRADPSVTPGYGTDNEAVVINPDVFKEMFPEWEELTKGSKPDPYAAHALHEESADVAAEALRRATARGYNILVDAVGDSEEGKFVAKIRRMKQAGYRTSVLMVDAETNVAIGRNVKRSQMDPGGPDDKRFVPVDVQKQLHRSTLLRMHDWINDGSVDRFEIYRTTEYPPTHVASGGGGSIDVLDDTEWRMMQVKPWEEGIAGAPGESLKSLSDQRLWEAYAEFGRWSNRIQSDVNARGMDDIARELEKRTTVGAELIEAQGGDLHVHSRWSDGHQSIEQMVRAAINRGHKRIVISDHAHHVLDRIHEQWEEIDALRGKYGDRIEILKGIEANLGSDGSLDVPDDVLSQLDHVNVGIHEGRDQDATRRILAAMDNPHVTTVAHPHASSDVDYDAIARRAAETGVALELNGRDLLRRDTGDAAERMLAAARKHGARIQLGSDAHRTPNFLDLKHSAELAAQLGITVEELRGIRGEIVEAIDASA